jgi:iron complex transport system permease protein
MADLCARTLGQGQELPLGALLALIGGPFFLWLVVQQKGEAL